jgi:hypothetical protein
MSPLRITANYHDLARFDHALASCHGVTDFRFQPSPPGVTIPFVTVLLHHVTLIFPKCQRSRPLRTMQLYCHYGTPAQAQKFSINQNNTLLCIFSLSPCRTLPKSRHDYERFIRGFLAMVHYRLAALVPWDRLNGVLQQQNKRLKC